MTKRTRLPSDLFMVIPFTLGMGTILRAVGSESDSTK